MECATDAVIVEEERVRRLKSEVFGHATAEPVPQTVERPAAQQQVPDQGREGGRTGQLLWSTRRGRWQETLEEGLELQATQKVLHHGRGTHLK